MTWIRLHQVKLLLGYHGLLVGDVADVQHQGGGLRAVCRAQAEADIGRPPPVFV